MPEEELHNWPDSVGKFLLLVDRFLLAVCMLFTCCIHDVVVVVVVVGRAPFLFFSQLHQGTFTIMARFEAIASTSSPSEPELNTRFHASIKKTRFHLYNKKRVESSQPATHNNLQPTTSYNLFFV